MADEEQDQEGTGAPTRALVTREVFLDTEAFRRLGFDTGKPSIIALLGHIGEERLQLHLTDITLSEIRRQIEASAEKAVEEIRRARTTEASWRKRAPTAVGSEKKLLKPLDAAKVGREAFEQFKNDLRPFNNHDASAQTGTEIFKAYFAREAPFDGQGGKSVKEFPDAFVIAALQEWCESEDTLMYVVTSDEAMLRAAGAKDRLVAVRTLDELLEVATLQHSPDVLTTVETIIAEPEFEHQLSEALDRTIDGLGTIYMGDLVEGEAGEALRAGDPEVVDWTVISASDTAYGVIVEFDIDILVQVNFDDISMASYDNEDGVYIGAEPGEDEVEENVRLRMFIQVDEDCSIKRAELLTGEVSVYGPFENYK